MSCRTRLRGAGGEGGDRLIGKCCAQRAEAGGIGAKLVAPFGNAVRFVDGEECQRHAPQPGNRVLPRQPFGRKIEQPVVALASLRASPRAARPARCELLSTAAGIPIWPAAPPGPASARSAARSRPRSCPDHRGQLVAERFSAAGRHDDGRIGARHQALHDALLHRTERIVTPVALQGRVQVFHGKLRVYQAGPPRNSEVFGFQASLFAICERSPCPISSES